MTPWQLVCALGAGPKRRHIDQKAIREQFQNFREQLRRERGQTR